MPDDEEGLLRIARDALADPEIRRVLIENFPRLEEGIFDAFRAAISEARAAGLGPSVRLDARAGRTPSDGLALPRLRRHRRTTRPL